MKRELSDSIADQVKRPRSENTTSLNYKSNQKQYEFNCDIKDTIEDVIKDLSSSRLKKKLKSTVTKLADRNKHTCRMGYRRRVSFRRTCQRQRG